MSRAARQVAALVGAALRTDVRSRDPIGGRISRSSWGLVAGLVFYVLVGACLCLFMAQLVPIRVQIVTYLSVAAVYVAFNILIEYQQILLSPEDVDILHWRPVSSTTLLTARSLHVLAYVSLLSAALLLAPAFVVAHAALGRPLLTLLAFVAAAFLNTVFATSLSIAAYAMILRAAPAQRFKKALAGVQVVMSLSLVLGYQLVGSLVERVDPQRLSQPPSWFEFLPATWFANLPLRAGWPAVAMSETTWWPTLAGVLLVGAASLAATRWIAPQYATQLVQAHMPTMRAVGSAASTRAQRPPWSERWFARAFARSPLARSGFRFFLAHAGGDRRLYAALVQVVALPVVLVALGLLWGETADPYRAASRTSLTTEVSGTEEGSFALFAAAYLLAMMVPTTLRLLHSSPAWSAAWIVFSSPTRHYDRFYAGVVLGVVYALLLPTAGLLIVLLLILWREPLHVLAHVALPVGTALLAFPILLNLNAQVPFSCAPVRHERTRELLRALAVLVPIGAIAYTHSALRAQPLLLVAIGAVMSVLGILSWPLVARRVRGLPHRHTFDA